MLQHTAGLGCMTLNWHSKRSAVGKQEVTTSLPQYGAKRVADWLGGAATTATCGLVSWGPRPAYAPHLQFPPAQPVQRHRSSACETSNIASEVSDYD